ncbi:MAG: DUF1206 domain-containing protein [Gemmatimonadales bacterium]
MPSELRPWVERLARAGYAAKGAVYLLIGILAFQAAAGAGGRATGTSGVLRTLVRQPFGRWLLAIVALGLLGYAVWRAVSAIVDPEGRGREGWKRLLARIGFACSALIHIGIGWEAVRLVLGRGGGGGDDGTESRTAELLSAPLGPWLVGLVAAGVASYGVAQIARGLRGDVAERLALGALGGDERRLVIRAARVGMVARGVVFNMIGVFLAQAALEHDPSEAGGLGEALRVLQQQPYAPVLLGAVAIGLVAYGAFQLVKARYRVISAV